MIEDGRLGGACGAGVVVAGDRMQEVGRGVEPFDAPAIRKIVRDAAASNYRFSSLIVGIATSIPFQMRNSE